MSGKETRGKCEERSSKAKDLRSEAKWSIEKDMKSDATEKC